MLLSLPPGPRFSPRVQWQFLTEPLDHDPLRPGTAHPAPGRPITVPRLASNLPRRHVRLSTRAAHKSVHPVCTGVRRAVISGTDKTTSPSFNCMGSHQQKRHLGLQFRVKMASTFAFVYAPANFPRSHRRPVVGDTLVFEQRESNTNAEVGMALVDGNTFCGWISKVNGRVPTTAIAGTRVSVIEAALF